MAQKTTRAPTIAPDTSGTLVGGPGGTFTPIGPSIIVPPALARPPDVPPGAALDPDDSLPALPDPQVKPPSATDIVRPINTSPIGQPSGADTVKAGRHPLRR